MLLKELLGWVPFRLDALGLVTLLGAEEVDTTIGNLSRNRWTGFLPTLGAYKIAGNDITKPIPGFVVYNASEGIMATDIPGWFSRWLLCQELAWNTTSFTMSYNSRPRRLVDFILMFGVGAISLGVILSLSIIVGDWWGVANAASMIISVFVRTVVVHENRKGLDMAAEIAKKIPGDVVSFWTLPTGRAITIRCPKGILIKCLLTTPVPPSPRLYFAARVLGWVGFGCHVMTLGMACLFNQILSVFLLVGATVIIVNRFWDDDVTIGTTISIARQEFEGGDFRAAAYANMELTPQQEEYMLAWNLFPQKGNKDWWTKYISCKNEKDQDFKAWDQVLAGPPVAAV